MQFGERLKSLREKNSLTQTAVAKELGVTQRAISYYENNNVAPNDPDTLDKLAKLLHVTLDELLGKDEGAKSQYHLLLEKLIKDTNDHKLDWCLFDKAVGKEYDDAEYREYEFDYSLRFKPSEFIQYNGFKCVNEQSYFTSYKNGGYLVEKIVSPNEEIVISLFIYYEQKFRFIADSKSLSLIEDLYILLTNHASGIINFIEEYLEDDMKPKKNNNTFGSDLPPDEEIPF